MGRGVGRAEEASAGEAGVEAGRGGGSAGCTTRDLSGVTANGGAAQRLDFEAGLDGAEGVRAVIGSESQKMRARRMGKKMVFGCH